MNGSHSFVRQDAQTDYLLLHAAATVHQARKQVRRSLLREQRRYAIIRRDQPTQAWFLEPLATVGASLANHEQETDTLAAALGLDAKTPVAVVDAFSIDFPDGPAVVLEDGRPIGYLPPATEMAPPPSSFPNPVEPVSQGPVADPKNLTVQPAPRALHAAMDATVPLHAEVTLLITLSATAVGDAGTVPVALASHSGIDLLVRPLDDVFEVADESSTLTITVPDDLSEPSEAVHLRAMREGTGKVRVYAFQEGLPLGYLTVVSQVTAAVNLDAHARTDGETTIVSRPAMRAPDLSMLVLEQRIGQETEISIRLSATDPTLGLNLKEYAPVRLRVSPQAYFEEFFKDIERLSLETERDAQRAVRRLNAKGSHLFEELFPAELRTVFWGLRDRISTIQIQSEEPWIPWELCRLQGVEKGEIVEGPFLCEAFNVTRWIPGVGHQPDLSLSRIALVVPTDSGLAYSRDELDFIMSLANDKRVVEEIPAYFDDVLDALEAGVYDGIHFSGHGLFRNTDPNHSGMELDDDDRLTPEDLSGEVRNLGKAKPLVFLNACQLGRSAMSLTDVGGWAPKFLAAGAGAFIGAYWSVYDDMAYVFAAEFYVHLIEGDTIGEAARKARLAARQRGDPSWLAYTVFAHPAAALRRL